jgi:uncharacterized protein
VSGRRLPSSAVLYDCRVTHARRAPVRNVFRYRTCQWLVDADDLPALGPLASFRAADHLGDPALPIADNVRGFAARRGIDLAGGRILMLAVPRVGGCVFNPLTVYWCHNRAGSVACVLAEVHNTYGQQHCYLLRPDQAGTLGAVKEFYVSPFYPVAGRYQLSLPVPAERLALSIVYRPPSGPPFTAVITGRGRPATWAGVARITARYPVPGAVTLTRIHWQGVGLYARGLRPLPRPVGASQEGTR